MLKKIFFGFLLLLIAAFGGLTYYVSNMDWNQYKQDIADKFSEISGKEIDFGGKINISLFPQPIITANNISVYNQGENKKPLATIEKMKMTVSFLSLLQGAPDVDSLSLSNAEIWVEQFENGGINWRNSQGAIIGSTDGRKTNLRSLTLQNAAFHYENKQANIKFDLDKINADVQASAYDGPYRLDGNFTKGGDHFAIAVGVGSLASLDGIEINLSVAHPATESSFRFDGNYNPQEHNIKGDFSGGSKKTAQIVNTLAEMNLMDADNQQELQFSSGVEVDENLIKLSSFVTKYSDDIEGSGSVSYPLNIAENEKRKIDIKYEFLNFNVRHLIPIIKAKYAEFKKNGSEYLPDTDFNINADLAAKHLDFNDSDLGYLENVTLKANWTDDILTLEEFFAAAAGDTSLSIAGNLREEDMKPQYFIKNSIISADFLSFANAFGADLKSYVQSSYRNAEFDFSILGDNEGFSIEGAELTMDKMKVNADFSTSFINEVPTFKLQAKADMLNLDNYLKPDTQKRDFLSQLNTDFEQTKFLKNLDFNLDIVAANAVFRSTPISSLAIKVQNEKGKLAVEEISMQKVAGAKIGVSGNIDFQKEKPQFNELKTEITTANIADLISQTDFNLPDWKLFKTKTFALSAIINGTLDELQTKAQMSADGVIFNYNGQIKNPVSEVELSGNLGLKTTNIGQLFEGFNLEIKNLPNKNAALNCSGNANIKSTAFAYTQAKCIVGSANYTGDISISQQDEKYNAVANIAADEFNLTYLINLSSSKTANFSNENSFDNTFIARPDLSRDILDFDIYKNLSLNLDLTAQKGVLKRLSFENLHFKLNNVDNALKFEEIDAVYKNTHYNGDIILSYANPEMPELKGNLRFADFDIGLLGGSTYMFNNGEIGGNTSFESKGNTAFELFSNVSGYISMSVENLNFKGFDFGAIHKDIAARKFSKGLFQTIRDNLQQGETEFMPFDVTIAMKNGLLTVANLSLNNQYANSELSFEIDLKDWKINSKMRISLADIDDIPPFEISLNGMLQKPSLEINIEKLVKHYDDNLRQAEEQEKAQQEAYRRELNAQMDAAQQNINTLAEQLNSYAQIIEDHRAKSKKDENISWYDKKLAQIAYINEDIDAMKTKAHTPDFSTDDINIISNKTETYLNDISSWTEELNTRFIEDLDIRFNKLLSTQSKINIKLQEFKTAYDNNYVQKLTELTKIGRNEDLSANEVLKNQKTEFDALSTELLTMNDELEKKLLPINTITDSKQKDEALVQAETLAKEIDNKFSTLETLQQSRLSELQKSSEDLYNQYLKEQAENAASSNILQNNTAAEVLKKAENANISKTQTSVLQELPEPQKVPSSSINQTNSAQGIIVRNYDEKTEKSVDESQPKSSLLKEVDGAVKKASGTIIVK